MDSTYTNLVTWGTVVDEKKQPDLSSKYISSVEMCPSSRFTLHVMKHTHRNISYRVSRWCHDLISIDLRQVIWDPLTYCTSKVFDIAVICLRYGDPSWHSKLKAEKSWECMLRFDSYVVSYAVHFQPSLSSVEHFCWSQVLVWANKINPKNQHILNKCASKYTHTHLPSPSQHPPHLSHKLEQHHVIPQSAAPKGPAYFIFIPSEEMVYFAALLSERFP